MQWQLIHPSKSPTTFPNSRTTPVQLQEAESYTGLTVSCYNFSLSTMLSLDFQFSQAKGKSNVYCYLLEMACYKPELTQVTFDDESGQIYFVRKGVGFRIGVASWNVEFTTASNFVAVAAAASVSTAETEVEVQTFGGRAISALKPLQDVQMLGGLQPESMRQIAIAAGKVAAIFEDKKKELEPAEMKAAALNVGMTGPVAAALSMQFANEQVYRQDTLLTALAKAARKGTDKEQMYLNPVICRAAYVGYGIRTQIDKPSDVQSGEAKRILDLGR